MHLNIDWQDIVHGKKTHKVHSKKNVAYLSMWRNIVLVCAILDFKSSAMFLNNAFLHILLNVNLN